MISRRKIMKLACASALATPQLVRALDGSNVLRQRTYDATPRCILMPDGSWTGFEIDMSKELCRLTGAVFQPTNEYLVWARAIKMLRMGDVSLMCGMSYREERAHFMDYIGPYDIEEIVVIVRKENADAKFETLEDFMIGDRKFERLAGGVLHKDFDRRFLNDPEFAARFMLSAGSGDQLEYQKSIAYRVASGRVFGALTDWYSYNSIKASNMFDLDFDPDTLTMVPAKVLGTPTTYLSSSLVVPQALRAELKGAYAETRSSGFFEDKWQQWYPDRPTVPQIS